jgi:hypothetical protein
VQRGAASFIASFIFDDRAGDACCAAAKPARNFSAVRHFYRRRLGRADASSAALLDLRGNNHA